MRAALLLGVLSLFAANAALALAPQDFAYGMPIMATELAAAYRVQLPVDVYKVSVHDLGDVRVFNAQGEAVPYAIRRMDLRAESGPAQPLPLFPLRGDAQSSAQGLRLTLDSPNGALKLQTEGHASDSGSAAQYLIDARTFAAAIAALQLSWPDSSGDFSGRIRIESSDDLGSWHAVLAAPIANLHAGGQQLVESRIVLPNLKAQFLRLSWIGNKPSFELNGVRAEAAEGEPRVNWSTVVVAGNAVAGGDYDFDLGARLPLQRVNLVLPEGNSVYLADFKSRPDGKAPWRLVTHAGVYRVATVDGEQSNGPIEIPVDHDRYWRVHLSGESGAAVALRLQGSWSPSEIEFLAHGKPPYILAYGSSSIDAAATDLSAMPSGTLIATATLSGRTALGGEARINALSALYDKRTLLWTVLVIAVAAMATMAARMARDRRR
jgi:hypothetical protein